MLDFFNEKGIALKFTWDVGSSQFCKLVCLWGNIFYMMTCTKMAKSGNFLQILGSSSFQISWSSYFPARFISWDSVAAAEIISDRKLLLCSHLVMAAAGTRLLLKEDFFVGQFRRFLRTFTISSHLLCHWFSHQGTLVDRIWQLDFETVWTYVFGHKGGFCVE